MTRTALVVGEALIDEFPDARVVAGAPLHVAAHLAARGWRALLLTRVGDDADGREIVAAATRLGVDTSLIEVDPDLPTGSTAITLTDDGHRFTVRAPAAWDRIAGPDVIPRHDVLVFGTLALRDPVAAATIAHLVGATPGMVVVDANLRPPFDSPTAIRTAVAAADVLKMNDDEVAPVAEALGMAPDPARLGPSWVVVTRGAHGAVLHHDGERWEVPGTPVEVVDTVGAGDAFLAVLVDGIVSGRDPDAVLADADRTAAGIVARRGGLPGTGRPGAAS